MSISETDGPPEELTIVADRTMEGRSRRLQRLRSALVSRGVAHRILRVDRPSQARDPAREAVVAGARTVVAAGGDALLNGVVNGMMNGAPSSKDLYLGVVPGKEGNDLSKTFGLAMDVERAVAHVLSEGHYDLDVVKGRWRDGGEERRGYLVNVVQIGVAGASAAATRRVPRALGSGTRRFLGFWIGFAFAGESEVLVRAGRRSYEGPAHDVIVGNGQFASGGSRISPRSYPGDGLLDVLIMKGPRSDSFTKLPAIWKGEHLPSPDILEWRAASVSVDADRSLKIEADGSYVGSTPATFEVIPKALRLRV